VPFAYWWCNKFNRGPLESLMRAVTS
jgi:uncharacterized membrane protein YeiB